MATHLETASMVSPSEQEIVLFPDISAADLTVRTVLELPTYEQFKEAQEASDATPKPSVLVIGLGPGANKIIEHYANKGYAVHALDSQIDVGGRLRNVAPTKAHYQTGLTELFRSSTHPNVHTITGIQVGLTQKEKGDIQLNDLVRLGGYKAVFLAVGTKETQVILQNGNNLGWEKGHEYGYGFTERAYRWMREGHAIGNLPLELNENGEQIIINGVGFVGIEDTARLIQAIQIDRALRQHGISIPSEELVENPKKTLALLQKKESPEGEKFRSLFGPDVDFSAKDSAEELKLVLQEKLGIKPLVAIYRGSMDKLHEKVKPNALKVFMESAFFTIEFNREIGSIRVKDNVRNVQLISKKGDGIVEEHETIPYAYIFSAIGGSRPDVRFGAQNELVPAGNMQQIDGVVIGYAGNATESKGNKKASENDAKARFEEADALLGDPIAPSEDAWSRQMAFIQNLELFANQRRSSDGNTIKDTLRQIPLYTLNKWDWVGKSEKHNSSEASAMLQGSDRLLHNVQMLIPLLPFVQDGIMHEHDVSLSPLFDDSWQHVIGYELYLTETDALNRVTDVRSLGLRITERGLERQYAGAFPWRVVRSEMDVDIAVYSRSQVRYHPELPVNFTHEINNIHHPENLNRDQRVLLMARDRVLHIFPWLSEDVIDGVTLLPVRNETEGGVSYIDVLYNAVPMGLRIHQYGLAGYNRADDEWSPIQTPQQLQHIVSDMTQDAIVPTTVMVSDAHMRELGLLRRELVRENAAHERIMHPEVIELREIPAYINQTLRDALLQELRVSDRTLTLDDITIRPIHNRLGLQHIEIFAPREGHIQRIVRLSPTGDITWGWGMLENATRFADRVVAVRTDIAQRIALGAQRLADNLTIDHRDAIETIARNIQVRLDGAVFTRQDDRWKRVQSNRRLIRFVRGQRIMQGVATQEDIRADRREEGFIDGAIYTTAALAGTMVSAGLRNIGVYEHVMTAVCSSAGALVPVGMAAIQPAMRDWERLQTRGSNENKRRKALRRLTGAGTAFLAGLFGESLFHSVLGSDHQIEKTPQAIKPKDPVDQPKQIEPTIIEKSPVTIYPDPSAAPQPDQLLTPSPVAPTVMVNGAHLSLGELTYTPTWTAMQETLSGLPVEKQYLVVDYASHLMNHDGWVSPEPWMADVLQYIIDAPMNKIISGEVNSVVDLMIAAHNPYVK